MLLLLLLWRRRRWLLRYGIVKDPSHALSLHSDLIRLLRSWGRGNRAGRFLLSWYRHRLAPKRSRSLLLRLWLLGRYLLRWWLLLLGLLRWWCYILRGLILVDIWVLLKQHRYALVRLAWMRHLWSQLVLTHLVAESTFAEIIFLWRENRQL